MFPLTRLLNSSKPVRLFTHCYLFHSRQSEYSVLVMEDFCIGEMSCTPVVKFSNKSGEADEDRDTGRRELPAELSRSVVRLSCETRDGSGTSHVYLVGTSHVSTDSCREVREVISCLKPEVVFLELCHSRAGLLTPVTAVTPESLQAPTMGEIVRTVKKKQNIFGLLYSWFISRVANKVEVFPGSEFRVAFQEAMDYGGRVILGDRPIDITFQRTWDRMPFWHKFKLLYTLFFQGVFLPSPKDLIKMLKDMDDTDMLTLVIQQLSKNFPTLTETIIDERDQYMSSKLLKASSEHEFVVVAVVGKGHVQGIQRHWKQPVDLQELLEVPSKKKAFSARKILISAGIAVSAFTGVVIISGIYLARKK